MSKSAGLFPILAAFLSIAFAPFCAGQEAIEEMMESAIARAVEKASPSVIQIQTVGGVDNVEGITLNQGPVTGVVVSDDGYVLSSMFNFANRPASIVTRTADGKLLPLQVIGKDYKSKLTVLKLESGGDFKPIEIAPVEDSKVGETTIALGKIYDPRDANVSVGILSAVGRVWGRAIQTDAKISPANYGGPLIDLQGRMIGVLTPISPRSDDLGAGTEWYDSGIGFAVPPSGVLSRLDAILAGEDQRPGLLGVAFRGGNIYSDQAVVATCSEGGPAARAGVKPGDTIVRFQSSPIQRIAQFKHAIGNLYAGEEVTLTIGREGTEIELSATLAAEIVPYQRPALGVVVDAEGTIEAFVPESPLARSGAALGDTIKMINGEECSGRDLLRAKLATYEVGASVSIKVESTNGEEQTNEVQLRAQRAAPTKMNFVNAKASKAIDIKVSDYSNSCFAIVPDSPERAGGVVVWLANPGDHNRQQLVEQWSPFCEDYNITALFPMSQDSEKWSADEIDFVNKAVQLVLAQSNSDSHRVVVAGVDKGGLMASLVAFSQRSRYRGLFQFNSYLASQIQNPINLSEQPLLVFNAMASSYGKKEEFREGIERLEESRIPVFVESDLRGSASDIIPILCEWALSVSRL